MKAVFAFGIELCTHLLLHCTHTDHIATSDDKAILYNDKSVLENHHCAAAWTELMRPDQNILANCSKESYQLVRKMVIELVLATDLGMHFDIISQFKSAVQGGQIDKKSDKSRLMINKVRARMCCVVVWWCGARICHSISRLSPLLCCAQMALKCGDLGHSAKNLTLHKRWTDRITEEFFQQGDDERKKGLPISPFMDRHKPNVPQSQVPPLLLVFFLFFFFLSSPVWL
jgi:hypothetical protein